MILSTVKNTHLNLNLSLKTFSYQTLSTCYFLSWCPFHKKKKHWNICTSAHCSHRGRGALNSRMAVHGPSPGARLPLLWWLFLPAAFSGLWVPQSSVCHIFTTLYRHTHNIITCTPNTLRHILHTSTWTPQKTHIDIHKHTKPYTVDSHHPWVMNNICLSTPLSLPLARLLAASWLNCHNVILSASLSPITEMCSDNQCFFFCTQTPVPRTSLGVETQATQRSDETTWCRLSGLQGTLSGFTFYFFFLNPEM